MYSLALKSAEYYTMYAVCMPHVRTSQITLWSLCKGDLLAVKLHRHGHGIPPPTFSPGIEGSNLRTLAVCGLFMYVSSSERDARRG